MSDRILTRNPSVVEDFTPLFCPVLGMEDDAQARAAAAYAATQATGTGAAPDHTAHHAAPARALTRPLWLVAGLVCLALGALGIILPLMPGTVFLIMAAACFARSSPRLEARLLAHPTFGPLIHDWRVHGAIALRAKIMAVAMMAVTPLLTVLMGAPVWTLAIQVPVLGGVALFVATRPRAPVSR